MADATISPTKSRKNSNNEETKETKEETKEAPNYGRMGTLGLALKNFEEIRKADAEAATEAARGLRAVNVMGMGVIERTRHRLDYEIPVLNVVVQGLDLVSRIQSGRAIFSAGKFVWNWIRTPV
jgi:hypothetical protein